MFFVLDVDGNMMRNANSKMLFAINARKLVTSAEFVIKKRVILLRKTKAKTGINSIGDNGKAKFANVKIQNRTIEMLVDSGSSCSIISKEQYHKIIPKPALRKCDDFFNDYQQNQIPVCGQCFVDIKYKNQEFANLRLIVTRGRSANILGRD